MMIPAAISWKPRRLVLEGVEDVLVAGNQAVVQTDLEDRCLGCEEALLDEGVHEAAVESHPVPSGLQVGAVIVPQRREQQERGAGVNRYRGNARALEAAAAVYDVDQLILVQDAAWADVVRIQRRMQLRPIGLMNTGGNALIADTDAVDLQIHRAAVEALHELGSVMRHGSIRMAAYPAISPNWNTLAGKRGSSQRARDMIPSSGTGMPARALGDSVVARPGRSSAPVARMQPSVPRYGA